MGNLTANRGINRRKKMMLVVGVSLLILFAIMIIGNRIEPDSLVANFSEKRQAPSAEHPFGTDTVGRDMLYRCLKGLSTSIQIGLISSLLGALLALVLGLAAALLGPKCDHVITWFVDLCMSVPHMVLMLMISFMLGGGTKGVALSVAVTHWPGITRIVRAEVLQLRNAQFVLVAEKLGQSKLRIAVRHILPHVLPQFLVGLVLMFPHAIMHEASITFLGFGLSMDTPAIGVILSESMKNLPMGMWWTALYPGIMLFGIVAMFHIIGKNIQALLNPYTGNE
ncbi:MAG: ABC transporter permease [Oscillospiraceae bacterium]|nr:ABC transporter permease [Oscillospiraceae bacterium]